MLDPARILLTGGSGLLGTELRRLAPTLMAPPRSRLDIRDARQVENRILQLRPALVLHAAADTRTHLPARDNWAAIEQYRTNANGTYNLVRICLLEGIPLVYISSDFVQVYSKRYRPNCELKGLRENDYVFSKFCAENYTRKLPEHLIIRTSFKPSVWPYGKAPRDCYTSADYVDVIAPLILDAVLTGQRGTLNVGTERKSLYELAVRRNPAVEACIRSRLPAPRPPRDISMSDLYRPSGRE